MKGSMLKRSTRKPSAREKAAASKTLAPSPAKISFQDPVGHELPASLHSFRWNVDKVERKLQEKIQEKTKIAGNFVYQQAYRLLECTRGEGIDFVSFKEQLRIKFGIILEDGELQLLFDKYDEDRNGTIDLHEFIRRVLPPDYNYGRQWFEISQQQSDEKQAALKRDSRNEFLSGTSLGTKDGLENTGETSNWTLETLMKQIQTKVVQKTPSGDDQYRRAFKMLRSGRDQGIRIKELRNNLKTKFGIFVSERQMTELFSQFDVDGSGEIDLKEFLQFVEPPAYPGNSNVPKGLWTADDDDGEDEEEEEDAQGEQEDEDVSGGDQYGGGRGGGVLYYNAGSPPHRHNPRHERPGSARGPRVLEETQYSVHHHHYSTTKPSGGGGGQAVGGASGPSTSTKNVIKKERPMSANPKKQAMLKQRREQMTASSSQLLLERQLLQEMEEEEEGGGAARGRGGHSVAKGTQTRRMSASLADIHDAYHLDRPATADAAKRRSQNPPSHHPSYRHCAVDGTRRAADHRDDGGESVCSGASSSSTLRPRSAGSVASSRPSSAASASSSVRGAAYMRRPSTPQYLRQKCLESRVAGVPAPPAPQPHGEVRHGVHWQSKLKKRISGGLPLAAKRGTGGVGGGGGGGGGASHVHRDHDRGHARDPRRHSFSNARGVASSAEQRGDEQYDHHPQEEQDEEEHYYQPRVARVHPKQHDTRPFSQEGKVLMRSKVSSAGCR